MLMLTDTVTGKRYEIVRFDNIRKGDLFVMVNPDNSTPSQDELLVQVAEADFPEIHGSFILREVV